MPVLVLISPELRLLRPSVETIKAREEHPKVRQENPRIMPLVSIHFAEHMYHRSSHQRGQPQQRHRQHPQQTPSYVSFVYGSYYPSVRFLFCGLD
jgi:hypothetical protein